MPLEGQAGDAWIPTPPATQAEKGNRSDSHTLLTLAWWQPWVLGVSGPAGQTELTVVAWGASGRRRGDKKPKRPLATRPCLGALTHPLTGVRVKSQTVFSRGLTAESAGELVERHTRCFCHTGLEKTRGNHTSKTKSPRGSSWAREQTTETPSTEATPPNHRGCFNARPLDRLAGPRSGTHGGVLRGAFPHPPTTPNRQANPPRTSTQRGKPGTHTLPRLAGLDPVPTVGRGRAWLAPPKSTGINSLLITS